MMRFYNPENFKQGQLLLSRYYPKELGIIIVSLFVSAGLVILVGTFAVEAGSPLKLAGLFILALLPVGLSFLLLNPKEGYHNAYHYFKLKIQGKKMQRKYMWEGIQFDDSDE